MSKSHAARVSAATVLVFATMIAFAACTHYLIGASAAYSGAWSTPLPNGVSSDPDTFRARLTPVRSGGHTRHRAALPSGDVLVRITAVGNTSLIKPDSAPSGVAVAQMENLDPTNIEAYYGLRPSSQADYYLWVDKRADYPDSARITAIEVPKVHGLSVRAGRQSNLHWCHHDLTYKGSDADFAEFRPECTIRFPSSSMKTSRGLSFVGFIERAAKSAAAIVSDYYALGGWIECNSGCCT